MSKDEFAENIKLAELYESRDYSGFWNGYRRGLRRLFYENFGTDEEHEVWMESANEKENKSRRDRGLGYRAGYAGKNPVPIMKVRTK